jgi:hypothetical protein
MLVLEEVAHDWHLGYLGALGLLGAIRYLGAIGLLSLHVDVWRLIFLKLSLPRDGVRGALHLVIPYYMCVHSLRMALT